MKKITAKMALKISESNKNEYARTQLEEVMSYIYEAANYGLTYTTIDSNLLDCVKNELIELGYSILMDGNEFDGIRLVISWGNKYIYTN